MYSFDDSTALHYAVIAEQIPAVEFLIDKCPELIDCTNDCGETAAGGAVVLGNTKILKLLLEKGAQIATDNSDRINILDRAYGYFKKAEDSVKEIIDFCEKDSNPHKLKEVCVVFIVYRSLRFVTAAFVRVRVSVLYPSRFLLGLGLCSII